MFDIQELRNAVARGDGYMHLSAGEAWAAEAKQVPQEKLAHPMAPSIKLMLDYHARKADKAFRKAAKTSDEMIDLAWDESWPAFLRRPIQTILMDGLKRHFPDLKPHGYDDDGNPLYSAEHLAEVFGTSPETLTDFAEKGGYTDAIHKGRVHTRH